jgi:hypothetical protein
MTAMPTLYALGTCLLVSTVAAGTTSRSWFEARTTGAAALTLRGSAEFGVVPEPGAAGPFVLTLGAQSPTGAVLFTSRKGERPEPGVYRLTDDGHGAMQALVVTGPVTRPNGVFKARSGTVTITRSEDDFIAGTFALDAIGYEAADLADESKPLRVQGTFTATPSRDGGPVVRN